MDKVQISKIFTDFPFSILSFPRRLSSHFLFNHFIDLFNFKSNLANFMSNIFMIEFPQKLIIEPGTHILGIGIYLAGFEDGGEEFRTVSSKIYHHLCDVFLEDISHLAAFVSFFGKLAIGFNFFWKLLLLEQVYFAAHLHSALVLEICFYSFQFMLEDSS